MPDGRAKSRVPGALLAAAPAPYAVDLCLDLRDAFLFSVLALAGHAKLPQACMLRLAPRRPNQQGPRLGAPLQPGSHMRSFHFTESLQDLEAVTVGALAAYTAAVKELLSFMVVVGHPVQLRVCMERKRRSRLERKRSHQE